MAPEDEDKQSLSLVSVLTHVHTHLLLVASPRPHTAHPQHQRPQTREHPAFSGPRESVSPQPLPLQAKAQMTLCYKTLCALRDSKHEVYFIILYTSEIIHIGFCLLET